MLSGNGYVAVVINSKMCFLSLSQNLIFAFY